jgi:hypothetical protein
MSKLQPLARNESVTALPVLVPSATERDGDVLFLLDERRPAARTRFQSVKRFRLDPKETPKRFLAMTRLLTLAWGEGFDYSLLKQSFHMLVEDAFGPRLPGLLIPKKPLKLKSWSERWLPPAFNREAKRARLVMWHPNGASAFSPGIYCRDSETAWFITLLLSALRTCHGCGILFVPRRRDQIYHDDECGARHRQARYRQRKK